MFQRLSPQARFIGRATASFAVLLAVWWFVLRPALLGWTRVSADVLLNLIPGASLQTGVRVDGGVWQIGAPVRINGVSRNVRVDTADRLPTQLTVCVPLFWAILLACPRRGWRGAAVGTLLMLAIPPIGLALYAAHVSQVYLFPNAPGLARSALESADYVSTTVAPYLAPVIAALVLEPALRVAVFGLDHNRD